jgi:enolase
MSEIQKFITHENLYNYLDEGTETVTPAPISTRSNTGQKNEEKATQLEFDYNKFNPKLFVDSLRAHIHGGVRRSGVFPLG